MNVQDHGNAEHDTSAESDDPHGLADRLSQLELCLESPVVPGELVSWAAAIHHSCEEAGQALRQEIDANHQREFAQISREDPELLHQVEQLRAADVKLLEKFELFERQICRFRERADAAEAHESKLDEQVDAIVNDGIRLVIEIRKQQQAISTWLLEAYHRDTGIGD